MSKRYLFLIAGCVLFTLGHESRREKSVTELNKEQSKRRLSRKQLAQDFASADSVSLSKVLEVYLVASSFTQ